MSHHDPRRHGQTEINYGDIFIVMGISGCGKSTVGEALAKKLPSYQFYEGDSFHPEENICKMSNGIPLTDGDRVPWLNNLALHIAQCRSHVIYSCSALKQAYRNRLTADLQQCHSIVHFIYLHGPYDVILKRIQNRTSHFMDPTLLQSQFQDLEPPTHAIAIPCTENLHDIVDRVVKQVQNVPSD